ncbi:MAG: PilZ domain-containing protein [Bryobacteraceae bacterium]
MDGPSKEWRHHPRFPISGPVSASWQDNRGEYQSAQVRGIDICETGLQIEHFSPLEIGSNVAVRTERYRFSATTAVRYCRQRGPKYRIGLEFTGGRRWHPPTPREGSGQGPGGPPPNPS